MVTNGSILVVPRTHVLCKLYNFVYDVIEWNMMAYDAQIILMKHLNHDVSNSSLSYDESGLKILIVGHIFFFGI